MRLSNKSADYTIAGYRIQANPIDVSTLAVVFIKEDYGDRVNPGAIIDIGANIGAFAMLAALNPESRIYAYEPVRSTFVQLQENVRRNGLESRVEVFNNAVAGRRETRTINVSPHGSPFSSLYGEGTGHAESIECVDLESVFTENSIERCDVLKLDCEGAEFEILQNAPSAILGRISEIWLECHEHDGLTAQTLIERLQSNGFRVDQYHRTDDGLGTLHLVR